MILYYITDRLQFPGGEQAQRRQLLLRIADAARAGVDYIQVREKNLRIRDLELLARDAVRCVRGSNANTNILINSRIDVALAIGADGVHLTSNDVAASDARAVWGAAQSQARTTNVIIGVSCPSVAAVRSAESHGANFAVLAPIFEKRGTDIQPLGLEQLRAAAGIEIPSDRRVEAGDNRNHMPVFALGGVTIENAAECIRAGAAGIAGIRLFQQGNLLETVKRLRELA